VIGLRHVGSAFRRTIFALAAVFLIAEPASAYLKFGVSVSGRVVAVKWNRTPVPYFVTEGGVAGVATTNFSDAVARAFATWEAVPTATVSYRFAGFTSAVPDDEDGINVIGFRAAPELDRVLASTSLLIDDFTGELIEVDIFFNSAFPWSVAAGGESGRFDLESIAVHEIGHFNGLGHSAIGETEINGSGRRVIAAESVMFPLAQGRSDITGRTLKADDIAGVSDLYPGGDFERETGSISGRVTKNGAGSFGAHVVAFHPPSGRLVGNFSLTENGDFSISGLKPGPHIVRVEPIDDADTDSFFDSDSHVDVDFRPAFFDKLVVVPSGGDSGSIEVKVVPK
jgi:matrixin